MFFMCRRFSCNGCASLADRGSSSCPEVGRRLAEVLLEYGAEIAD